MKVWRARDHHLVECEACTSRGRPHAVVITTVANPGRVADQREHLAVANKIRTDHVGRLRAVIEARRRGRITAAECTRQTKEIANKHAASLKELLDSAPERGDAIETVEKCPWCGEGDPATVVDLPDNVSEPVEWRRSE